ncbi:serine hydrolase domain-containing protein [Adhaeribacter pallidiroseus]|uniref:6-aminohexanoate-oligomer exohydrolase n=1 Tax=Adhaeribacter pallidiroseus TaxID=2072847 RepID=A0A369QMJ9_9BACT|nr:serine hydrolase [Adhaeribacter pallidiroseus]RDC63448.1 6-aminohexanoate-oligomer exohydrolase [Adhaeribacter pallidiroseus]
MAIKNYLLLAILIFHITTGWSQGRDILLFGKVISKGKTEQSRFEVQEINKSWNIVYAPYGQVPVAFTDVLIGDSSLVFKWNRKGATYNCALQLMSDSILHFAGTGVYKTDTIYITIRPSNAEDAQLQGNFLAASELDLQILDTAVKLLQGGKNWNRKDTRICEGGKFSLFCALYQASLMIKGDYQHLRPVMRMVRNSIALLKPEKQYEHILKDYNNEASSFEAINLVFRNARQLIEEEINQIQQDADKFSGWKKNYILALNARTAGRWESAATYFVKAAERKGKQNFEQFWDATIMNSRASKIDEAFRTLDMSIAAGMFDISRAKSQKRLAPLRNDPRWRPALERMSKARPLEYFYWPTGTLVTAKVNPKSIIDLTAKIESGLMENIHSFLLAKDGKLVYERYFNEGNLLDHHEMRSAHKSITALLVGIAIDKGYIKNVHDPVLNYFPSYRPSKNWDERKKKITVYHLLTMTSGLISSGYGDEGTLQNQTENKDWVTYMLDAPLTYDPGIKCEYSSAAMHILNGIIENASGMMLDEFSEKYLFTPLEIYHKSFKYDPSGRIYGAGGAEMTSRDMLKIGQLVINDGKWNNTQIVSPQFLTQLQTKHSKVYSETVDYGYLWHIKELRTLSGKKIISLGAWGNGGQFILAIPQLKIVGVFTAGNYERGDMGNTLDYFQEVILPSIDL